MKNTYWVLLLVKLYVFACNFSKSNTPPWVFSRFLDCTNGTKSRKASQISILDHWLLFEHFLKRCCFTTLKISILINERFYGLSFLWEVGDLGDREGKIGLNIYKIFIVSGILCISIINAFSIFNALVFFQSKLSWRFYRRLSRVLSNISDASFLQKIVVC